MAALPKISTRSGTWVSVGPLRARFIAACAPLARNVVIAGIDRDEITAVVVLDIDGCRLINPALSSSDIAACARDEQVRNASGNDFPHFNRPRPVPRRRSPGRCCSTCRSRSIAAKSPTRGRSTSVRCSITAAVWLRRFIPTPFAANVITPKNQCSGG